MLHLLLYLFLYTYYVPCIGATTFHKTLFSCIRMSSLSYTKDSF